MEFILQPLEWDQLQNSSANDVACTHNYVAECGCIMNDVQGCACPQK